MKPRQPKKPASVLYRPRNTESKGASLELFGGQGKALQDKREVPSNTFMGGNKGGTARDF